MPDEVIVSLIDAVSVTLILINAAERVEHMNPPARALVGAAALGRHYITGLRRPELLDAVEGALASGQPRDARYVATTGAGLEARAVPLTLHGARWVLITILDVSDREEAGLARRDFVANVSHELRTPLTAMAGFIETLRGAARDDPAARDRFLDIMAREADRMNRLVDDLLSLSRVEADERVRPTRKVNIVDIARAAIARLETTAADRGVTIERGFEADNLTAPGDSDQLTQVFLNLIENALKYGAKGGRVTVRVASSDHEPALRAGAVRIDVTDYGDGIDPIHVPRLTERFYRVDDHRSREIGGTGLGLAIVKHIVNRHRGRLRIVSEPGKGSRFSVLLPVE